MNNALLKDKDFQNAARQWILRRGRCFQGPVL